MADKLYFNVYRDSSTSSDLLVRSIIDEFKNFVFSSDGLVFSSQGYSGIPLVGEIPLCSPENDICKTFQVLFKISGILKGLVFTIRTLNHEENPLYVEAKKNDVIPTWAETAAIFNENVCGMDGVLHVINPEIKAKYPNDSAVDIVRKAAFQTRNILVTESLREKLDASILKNFGMHRMSVNLPLALSYVAKERPDLLSCAIQEYKKIGDDKLSKLEKKLNVDDAVMVHVVLNDNDYKVVTEVADIESPTDIVSHRVALALIAFDEKHSSIPNGVNMPISGVFQKVSDQFERERLEAIRSKLFGTPQSVSHMYQCAKALTTNKHHAECKKIFVDDSSSADQHSSYSGDEEDGDNMKYAKKQVFKKKKRGGELGKKRELAAVIKRDTPERPDVEYVKPTNSGQLKNFERAVNGDDVYKESSDGDSLGEDEDMDLFVTKSKKKILEAMKSKQANHVLLPINEKPAESEDDGFDVADLLRAAPPLAKTDEFEDFDDI